MMELMRVLYLNSRGDNLEYILQISKLLKAEKIYSVYSDDEGKSEIFDVQYGFWDIIYGDYDYNRVGFAPHHDPEYCERLLSEYSVETIEMMNRMNILYTDFRVDLYHQHVSFWNSFLEFYDISHVIFVGGPPHEVHDYVIYRLCIQKNIETYICGKVTVGPLEYAHMSDSIIFERLEDIDNSMGKIVAQYSEYLNSDNFVCDVRLDNYFEQTEINYQRYTVKEIGKNHLKSSIKWRGGNRWYKRLWMYIKTYDLFYCYRSLTGHFDMETSYLFFPLHFQPENTTAPLGGLFANQLEAIRMICNILPEGVLLFVKEHPAQIAFGRQKWFYDKLAKLHNVRLIDSRISSYALINNAIAVISITGTSLWEAALIGKPSICLGFTFAQYLSGVFRVKSEKECKEAIDMILDGKYLKSNRREISALCMAIYHNSFVDEKQKFEMLYDYLK